jgi:hypothetical protein
MDSAALLIDQGWTVSELPWKLGEGQASGQIAVSGSDELSRDLRYRLGRAVRPVIGPEELRDHDLLVVGDRSRDADARRWQAAAHRHRCPIVIWAEGRPPLPEEPLAELFSMEPGQPLSVEWLTRFLRHLLTGLLPERARSRASAVFALRDAQSAVWMRGGFRDGGWSCAQEIPIPPEWLRRLDRSEQEEQLKGSLRSLLADGGPPIHVVLTTGPDHSGLDLFRDRVGDVAQEVVSSSENYRRAVVLPVRWVEFPAFEEQQLWRTLEARSRRSFVQALGGLGSSPEQPTLVCIDHGVASLVAHPDFNIVSLDALSAYLKALRELARDLKGKTVRLLVHCSFIGDAHSLLSKAEIEENSREICIDLLPELGRVPEDELKKWLKNHKIAYTKEDLAEAVGASEQSYDVLVDWLYHRYSIKKP